NDEILTRWNLEKILTNRVRGIDSNPHLSNKEDNYDKRNDCKGAEHRMTVFTSKKEYIEKFQEKLAGSLRANGALAHYVAKQLDQLNCLVQDISQDTFWERIPVILGIDAKLVLITDLMRFDDFTDEEIIRIVEQDYHYYFKELCGYTLGMEAKHSLIFNIK
ncbi:DUF7006 family protein, partial [Candidatus Enterenecus avicola]